MNRRLVIDLTGAVGALDAGARVRIAKETRELFDDLPGVLTDVDGTLAHGIEPLHQDFWRGAIMHHVRVSMFNRRTPVALLDKLKIVRGRLDAHLGTVFANGGELISGVTSILKDENLLSPDLETPEQLDRLLTELRIPLIEAAIDEGRVELMLDTVPTFQLFKTWNMRIGLYTNSDRVTGETICKALFTPDEFDRLIPGTPEKPRRLYGSDVPRGRRKPDPWGWVRLAEQLLYKPQDCCILEDRLNVLEAAFAAEPFRFGVLVLAPDHLKVDESYLSKLHAARRQLEGSSGPPIIMVRNLSLVRIILASDEPDPLGALTSGDAVIGS
jgi:beta-phosphoglucomutase-like phosphatase (HAD superfamily)